MEREHLENLWLLKCKSYGGVPCFADEKSKEIHDIEDVPVRGGVEKLDCISLLEKR